MLSILSFKIQLLLKKQSRVTIILMVSLYFFSCLAVGDKRYYYFVVGRLQSKQKNDSFASQVDCKDNRDVIDFSYRYV